MVIPIQRLPLHPDSEISPEALARGKRAMVQDAAWASLVGALYDGVILVGFALELGATPFIIGLLGAIPAIGAPAFKAADGSNSPTALVPPRPCVLP